MTAIISPHNAAIILPPTNSVLSRGKNTTTPLPYALGRAGPDVLKNSVIGRAPVAQETTSSPVPLLPAPVAPSYTVQPLPSQPDYYNLPLPPEDAPYIVQQARPLPISAPTVDSYLNNPLYTPVYNAAGQLLSINSTDTQTWNYDNIHGRDDTLTWTPHVLTVDPTTNTITKEEWNQPVTIKKDSGNTEYQVIPLKEKTYSPHGVLLENIERATYTYDQNKSGSDYDRRIYEPIHQVFTPEGQLLSDKRYHTWDVNKDRHEQNIYLQRDEQYNPDGSPIKLYTLGYRTDPLNKNQETKDTERLWDYNAGTYEKTDYFQADQNRAAALKPLASNERIAYRDPRTNELLIENTTTGGTRWTTISDYAPEATLIPTSQYKYYDGYLPVQQALSDGTVYVNSLPPTADLAFEYFKQNPYVWPTQQDYINAYQAGERQQREITYQQQLQAYNNDLNAYNQAQAQYQTELAQYQTALNNQTRQTINQAVKQPIFLPQSLANTPLGQAQNISQALALQQLHQQQAQQQANQQTFTGTYSTAPTTPWYQQPGRLSEQYETTAHTDKENQALLAAGAFGLGALQGGIDQVYGSWQAATKLPPYLLHNWRNPSIIWDDTQQLATDTYDQATTELRERPTRAIGYITGQAGTGKIITLAPKALRYGADPFGTSIEQGAHYAGKGVTYASSHIPELPHLPHFLPDGSTAGFIEKNVPKAFREEYKDYYGITKTTTRAPIEIGRLPLERVDKATPKVAENIREFLKSQSNKQQGFTGGSTVLEGALQHATDGTQHLAKVPGDIEWYARKPSNFLTEAKQFFEQKGHQFTIERSGKKAVAYVDNVKIDLNPIQLGEKNIQSVTNARTPSQIQHYIVRSSDGIDSISPNVLVRRSLIGGFETGPKKQALYRYSKDAPRLVTLNKALLEKGLAQAKNKPFGIKQLQQYHYGSAIDTLEPYLDVAERPHVKPISKRAYQRTQTSTGYNAPNAMQQEVMQYITKKNGYTGGAGAITFQTPEGTFRPTNDLDAYFPNATPEQIKHYANDIHAIVKKHKKFTKQAPATSHIKIKDWKGKDIVDIGTRNQPGDVIKNIPILNKKGTYIRVRDAKQVIADKKSIAQALKYEKETIPLKIQELPERIRAKTTTEFIRKEGEEKIKGKKRDTYVTIQPDLYGKFFDNPEATLRHEAIHFDQDKKITTQGEYNLQQAKENFKLPFNVAKDSIKLRSLRPIETVANTAHYPFKKWGIEYKPHLLAQDTSIQIKVPRSVQEKIKKINQLHDIKEFSRKKDLDISGEVDALKKMHDKATLTNNKFLQDYAENRLRTFVETNEAAKKYVQARRELDAATATFTGEYKVLKDGTKNPKYQKAVNDLQLYHESKKIQPKARYAYKDTRPNRFTKGFKHIDFDELKFGKKGSAYLNPSYTGTFERVNGKLRYRIPHLYPQKHTTTGKYAPTTSSITPAYTTPKSYKQPQQPIKSYAPTKEYPYKQQPNNKPYHVTQPYPTPQPYNYPRTYPKDYNTTYPKTYPRDYTGPYPTSYTPTTPKIIPKVYPKVLPRQTTTPQPKKKTTNKPEDRISAWTPLGYNGNKQIELGKFATYDEALSEGLRAVANGHVQRMRVVKSREEWKKSDLHRRAAPFRNRALTKQGAFNTYTKRENTNSNWLSLLNQHKEATTW